MEAGRAEDQPLISTSNCACFIPISFELLGVVSLSLKKRLLLKKLYPLLRKFRLFKNLFQ